MYLNIYISFTPSLSLKVSLKLKLKNLRNNFFTLVKYDVTTNACLVTKTVCPTIIFQEHKSFQKSRKNF